MAIRYRTKALVLKRTDLWEADRMFTVFTKQFGKLDILGRSIRKIKSKLRGGMRLFSLTTIEFIQGKTYKTLTDASPIQDFLNLREDLKRLRLVYEISEISDDLIRGQEKDEKIWDLLKGTFQRLNQTSLSVKEYWLIYYYFIWNFLSILGYKPELNFCSICQKKLVPQNLYFSPETGGVVCSNCFKKTNSGKRVKPNLVKILRLFVNKKMDILKRLKFKKAHREATKEITGDYLSFIRGS